MTGKAIKMVDINLLIAIGGIVGVFLAMYFSTKNSDKEIKATEDEKTRAAGYKEGQIDKTLSQISEITSRTESKLDGLTSKLSDISRTADDALRVAETAEAKADKAHIRIDSVEGRLEDIKNDREN
jgi:SMC interacting uncharacterized protein involved in chromosome segregation